MSNKEWQPIFDFDPSEENHVMDIFSEAKMESDATGYIRLDRNALRREIREQQIDRNLEDLHISEGCGSLEKAE